MKKIVILRVLAALYTASMLYLLFIQRLILCGFDITSLAVPDYASALSERFEPFPFRTIAEFISMLKAFSVTDLAFRNLAGNIILFIPIGLFLPALFPKQRKIGVFLLTTVIIICAVEITQLFTLLGTCDIDDLILNTTGASIGFLISKLIRKDRTEDKEH